MLRAQLECQYGLLEQLVREGALSEEQRADVARPQHNSFEQNDALLDLLLRSVDTRLYECFVAALRRTHQGHLAALLDTARGDTEICFKIAELPNGKCKRAFNANN